MAAPDPDANIEGKCVGQATKDGPGIVSIDSSNPTGYNIAVLVSHVGAQRGSDNTIVEVPLCHNGAGACTLSCVLTGTVKVRVLDLHGANNGLVYRVFVLDAAGRYTFQLVED